MFNEQEATMDQICCQFLDSVAAKISRQVQHGVECLLPPGATWCGRPVTCFFSCPWRKKKWGLKGIEMSLNQNVAAPQRRIGSPFATSFSAALAEAKDLISSREMGALRTSKGVEVSWGKRTLASIRIKGWVVISKDFTNLRRWDNKKTCSIL